jgi:hypothetical protein
MMIDLLAGLYDGTISPDQAWTICNEVLDSSEAADIRHLLGFSNIEWTAYCWGASFVILAQWRYSGWPDVCPICTEKIVIPNYRWMPRKMNGDMRLFHVACIPTSQKKRNKLGIE